MGFEKGPEENSEIELELDDDKIEQEENTIEDTSSFREAVEQGNHQEAENWLMNNLEYSDKRWLDHRSLELFRAYRQKQDWISAKRMIELANGESAKQGRIDVLEKESGIAYDQI